MERPVGLLSEEPLRIDISVVIKYDEEIEDGVKCKGCPVYRIVPSVSFSPRTNVYGRMSDRIVPMIERVGLNKYIWWPTDLFPSHNIQNLFVQIQLMIDGSDNVAFKVIVLSMNGK